MLDAHHCNVDTCTKVAHTIKDSHSCYLAAFIPVGLLCNKSNIMHSQQNHGWHINGGVRIN